MSLRAGLDGCGKSRHTGIRSPDYLTRSEALYRPRYRVKNSVLIWFGDLAFSGENKKFTGIGNGGWRPAKNKGNKPIPVAVW